MSEYTVYDVHIFVFLNIIFLIVTNEDFLKVTPSDLHLRRMSLLYSRNDIRELAIRLGLSATKVNNMLETDETHKWNFEVLKQCRNSVGMTFNQIKEAIQANGQDCIHKLCQVITFNRSQPNETIVFFFLFGNLKIILKLHSLSC